MLDLLCDGAEGVALASLVGLVDDGLDGVKEEARASLAVPADSAEELFESAFVGQLAGDEERDAVFCGCSEVDAARVPLVDDRHRVGLQLLVGLHAERRNGEVLWQVLQLLFELLDLGYVDKACHSRLLLAEEGVPVGDLEILFGKTGHGRDAAVVYEDVEGVQEVLVACVSVGLERSGGEADHLTDRVPLLKVLGLVQHKRVTLVHELDGLRLAETVEALLEDDLGALGLGRLLDLSERELVLFQEEH